MQKHGYKIAGFTIVAIIGIVVYLSATNVTRTPIDEASKGAASSSEVALSADERAYVTATNGDVAGAKKQYDARIAQAKSQEQKRELYIQKATLLFNIEQFDDAYAAAQQAEKIDANALDTVQLLAAIYEKKQQTQEAIEYHNKAIQLLDKESPMYTSSLQTEQNAIKRLQGAQ